MKDIRNKFAFVFLTVFMCFSFLTCDFVNPIIEKWWVDEEDEEEPDYIYAPIIKSVPHIVYETIIENKYIYEIVIKEVEKIIPGEIETIYVDRPLPPEILLQYISIVNIDYVIFAGNSDVYNGQPVGGATPIQNEERNRNFNIISNLALDFQDEEKDDYMVIFHGHANPTAKPGTPAYAAEIEELQKLSEGRAIATMNAFVDLYNDSDAIGPDDPVNPNPPRSCPELQGRMTIRGYGGGRNVSGPNSSYASLNRRVEVIVFTIDEDASSVINR
ncbi:MAG: hypothetical protein FWB83_01570 [Treponema sp.]|nr:hypothetical protein [Treponema sp.]MCL2245401.1 hypothetical protein [Treponema sp.]